MKSINNSKIIERSQIKSLSLMYKSQGKTVVFTNGCFDILHAGHTTYLQAAANFGDILIVGLNSDTSVNKIKGDKRPIIGQIYRAELLAALECVDYVVLFDEPDPYTLIRDIQPHVLVKGADWSEDNIIGADLVKKEGGRVERIELVPKISTTTIIDQIIKLYCGS